VAANPPGMPRFGGRHRPRHRDRFRPRPDPGRRLHRADVHGLRDREAGLQDA
jgi:hypothetical protein